VQWDHNDLLPHCTFAATYILLKPEISYPSSRSHHFSCLLHRTSQQVHLMSSTCRALYRFYACFHWNSSRSSSGNQELWCYSDHQHYNMIINKLSELMAYKPGTLSVCFVIMHHSTENSWSWVIWIIYSMSAPFIFLERDLFYGFCTLWCGCHDSVSSEQLASLGCYTLLIISSRSGLYWA